ncbi:hypothetical protein A2U01_0085041, partial [Trifolium medium]|nr:hypothetical protein [Trifolium medium]
QKVELAKKPAKERLAPIIEETETENGKDVENEEDYMDDDDLLDDEPNFDVLVNVISILPLEYDVQTEINEVEEDFEISEMANHKP